MAGRSGTDPITGCRFFALAGLQGVWIAESHTQVAGTAQDLFGGPDTSLRSAGVSFRFPKMRDGRAGRFGAPVLLRSL